MPILVGIAGGTGSGKSTLARRIVRSLGDDRCVLVTQDNYYRTLADLSHEARARVNFDHPDAIDSELLIQHVRALKSGEPVEMPRYDFARHVQLAGGTRVEPRPVIIVEGILVLVWPALAEQLDVKVYVDTPMDVRLARRVRRDIADRGRDLDGVLDQYLKTVRPMHESHVAPSREVADLVVPGEGANQVVVKLLTVALSALASGG
ncbi:MAG: uridine kinase [Deltaproteobacteria bacterium]|nr:uridine kinase [Deltaproteobacteria bacterium]MCB9788090.1 uridine kinase [Deltaproteobacteria bacterium]